MTEDTDRTPSASGLADAATMRVPTHEANNYSRILTLLGMEEEGDPVEAVDELLRLRCDCTTRVAADGVAVTFCGSAQMSAARATDEYDRQQARIGLVSHSPGNAQRLREAASFLRSSNLALEADAAADCERAARWIDEATRALRPSVANEAGQTALPLPATPTTRPAV